MTSANDDNIEIEEVDDETGEVTPAAPEAPKPVKTKRGKLIGTGIAGADGVRPTPKTIGVSRSPTASRDADLAWAEILQQARAEGIEPNAISIRVTRTDPPPSEPLGSFDASNVVGSQNQSAADAFREYVIQHFHMTTAYGAAKYEIYFIRKSDSHTITIKYLTLPAPDAIAAIRNSRRAYAARMPGAFAEEPLPMPVRVAPQAPPQLGAAPANDEVAYLRQQLRMRDVQNEEMRQEMLTAAREGRQAVVPPTLAAPQPQQGPIDYERLADLVALRLGGAKPVTGVAAPPPPAPQVVAEQSRSRVGALRELVSDLGELKGLGKAIAKAFGGDGESDDAVEATATPVVEPEKKPETPFDLIPLQGGPYNYARNRETGKIDIQGTVMGNLHTPIAEKIVEIGEIGMKRLASIGMKEPESEVVKKIPTSAVNAGVAEVVSPNGSASSKIPPM